MNISWLQFLYHLHENLNECIPVDTAMSELVFFDILLLCLSSSLDNFSLGVSYTIANKYIPLWANFSIAIVNGTSTLVVMLIGDSVKRYLPPDIAAYVGASIFIILALDGFRGFVMMIRESSTQEENKLEDTTTVSLLDNPSGEEPTSNLNSEVVKAEDSAKSSSAESLPDENSSTKNSIYFKNIFPGVPITIKEVILIALGTSFTNIASGLAAALAGYNAYVMSVTAVFTNFVLLLSGQVIGVNFGALVPEKYVKLISSLVLLAIAIPYFCN